MEQNRKDWRNTATMISNELKQHAIFTKQMRDAIVSRVSLMKADDRILNLKVRDDMLNELVKLPESLHGDYDLALDVISRLDTTVAALNVLITKCEAEGIYYRMLRDIDENREKSTLEPKTI